MLGFNTSFFIRRRGHNSSYWYHWVPDHWVPLSVLCCRTGRSPPVLPSFSRLHLGQLFDWELPLERLGRMLLLKLQAHRTQGSSTYINVSSGSEVLVITQEPSRFTLRSVSYCTVYLFLLSPSTLFWVVCENKFIK